ncbi:MAG TPA: ATP-dependent helicase [Tepidisphaeraceae bacterium]|jgi:DNA helicase-2/ATP-dependent DNA helicase PcrA
MDIAAQLNPAQALAVETTQGPVLVIAGAGSGKTRVIEYRVLNLIQKGVSPGSILLLTFTRRAAREMINRASRHDPRASKVDGGTFHSFANGVIRTYAGVLGLAESFTILDQGDAEEAVGRVASRMGVYQGKKRFPRKDTLQHILSMSVNRRMSIAEVLAKEYPHFVQHAAAIEAIQRQFTEFKLNSNSLDYDDLLVYLLILLEQEPVRNQLAERFRYVMVDEFQDTNAIQGDITALLAEKHQNVMVVGDDAQSIYRFRGAYRENILKFPQRFEKCRVITLEQNYRSTQRILDVANASLENMSSKYSKSLVAAKGEQGERPAFVIFKNDQDEADWVADQIKLLRDEGTVLNHQGVVYRSSYLSLALQVALNARNIPYAVYGGLRFNETAHVKDVCAHLKLAVNPKDTLAWNRALQLLPGVGPATAERLTDRLVELDSLAKACAALVEASPKNSRAGEGVSKLGELLWRIGESTATVGDRYEWVLDYYKPLLKEKYDDWGARIEDLESLRQIAQRYSSLDDLLADLTIEPPEKGAASTDAADKEDEKPVVLSTIHSAKGLEWEVVFLMGAKDGVLPSSRALEDQEDLEEEHRLFYVAVTRAKRQLILTMHHYGNGPGIQNLYKPSRFVEAANVRECLDFDSTRTQSDAGKGKPSLPAGIEMALNKDSLLKRIAQLQGRA